MPTLAELAEDTASPTCCRGRRFDLVDRGDLFFEAGPNRCTVHRIRLEDVGGGDRLDPRRGRRRGLDRIEWWVGWPPTPADLGERLLALGLVPDEPPTLTG